MKDLEWIRTALRQAIEIAEKKGDRHAVVANFIQGGVIEWPKVTDPILRIVALQYQHTNHMLNELIIYLKDQEDTDALAPSAEEVANDPLDCLKPNPWDDEGQSWARLAFAVEAYVNDPDSENAARLLLANEQHSVTTLALQRYICQRIFTRHPTLVSPLYFDSAGIDEE